MRLLDAGNGVEHGLDLVRRLVLRRRGSRTGRARSGRSVEIWPRVARRRAASGRRCTCRLRRDGAHDVADRGAERRVVHRLPSATARGRSRRRRLSKPAPREDLLRLLRLARRRCRPALSFFVPTSAADRDRGDDRTPSQAEQRGLPVRRAPAAGAPRKIVRFRHALDRSEGQIGREDDLADGHQIEVSSRSISSAWRVAGSPGCPRALQLRPRRPRQVILRERRNRAGARSRRAARARERLDRRRRRSRHRTARPRPGTSARLNSSAGGRQSAFIAPCGRP